MRHIKLFGLAAMLAVMATAFIGASGAMATGNTTLCSVDQDPCNAGNQAKTVHFVSTKANTTLLNSTLNVSCIALFSGNVTSATLAIPLVIEGGFTYSNCTFGCTVTEASTSSILQVLRTANEVGTVTGEGKVHVNCFGFIDCVYNGKGLSGSATGGLSHGAAELGHTTFIKAPVEDAKEAGCPKNATLDALFESLTKQYIKS